MPISSEFYVKHADLMNMVREAYGQKYRMYHTMCHINKMLEGYKELVKAGLIEYNELDVIIICMHDFVYQGNSDNNEFDSARYARFYLEDHGYSKVDIAYVHNGIMATQSHEATNNLVYNYILDLDCQYLGESKDVYNLSVAGIRCEYLYWVERRYWDYGRRNWLQSTLKRDTIFHSLYFQEKYELAARENLKRELGDYI